MSLTPRAGCQCRHRARAHLGGGWFLNCRLCRGTAGYIDDGDFRLRAIRISACYRFGEQPEVLNELGEIQPPSVFGVAPSARPCLLMDKEQNSVTSAPCAQIPTAELVDERRLQLLDGPTFGGLDLDRNACVVG